LIAHVAICTGWTWDYIAEHVDIPRLESLNRYLAAHPPLHMMVAAYLGIKPKPPTPEHAESDYTDLFGMFNVRE
jgi:hypothetical protein